MNQVLLCRRYCLGELDGFRSIARLLIRYSLSLNLNLGILAVKFSMKLLPIADSKNSCLGECRLKFLHCTFRGFSSCYCFAFHDCLYLGSSSLLIDRRPLPQHPTTDVPDAILSIADSRYALALTRQRLLSNLPIILPHSVGVPPFTLVAQVTETRGDAAPQVFRPYDWS